MNEREYKRRQAAKNRIISHAEKELLEKNTNEMREISNSNYVERDRERNKARQQVQTKKFRFGAYAFTVIVLAIAIVVMSLYLLFFLQNIKVVDNEYSTDGEIVRWIKEDKLSTNTIATYLKYNYGKVELPGKVESVDLTIKNPWTLQVSVTDKTPISGIITNTEYVYCDKEGTAIITSSNQIEGIPLIEGIDVSEATLYEKVPVEDTDIFTNVLEVTNLLHRADILSDEIHCGRGAGVDIVIGEITIHLGDGNYEEKIAQIKPVLLELPNEMGEIHLENFSESNETISFTRKKSEN